MLTNESKTINMNAYSEIDGVTVAQFYIAIDSSNPDAAMPGRSIMDTASYKANRDTVMADQKAFEDKAFAFVDVLKQDKAEETVQEA